MPTTLRQKNRRLGGQRFRVRRGPGEKAARDVISDTSFGLMPAIDKVEAAELTRDQTLIMAAEDRDPSLQARWYAEGDEPWQRACVSDQQETDALGSRKLKRDQ